VSMKSRIVFGIIIAVIIAVGLNACKKTYFHVSEQITGNVKNRFTTKSSYYLVGQSLALTGGRYAIHPGDSVLLFIEGQAKVPGVGQNDVAGFDVDETARFFFVLPPLPQPGTYDLQYNGIAEILNDEYYSEGTNLFTCQSGKLVIDSVKSAELYGRFVAEFLNTQNKKLSALGDFKANQK